MIKPGLYQHFKGAMYRVMEVAHHSETEEPLVIYRALYGEKGVWARPLSMFTETVERDGSTRLRFACLDNQSEVEQRLTLRFEPAIVKEGQLAEFELAFAATESMIITHEAYITHNLTWSVNDAHKAVLSIFWQSIEQANGFSFEGLSDYLSEDSIEFFSLNRNAE